MVMLRTWVERIHAYEVVLEHLEGTFGSSDLSLVQMVVIPTLHRHLRYRLLLTKEVQVQLCGLRRQPSHLMESLNRSGIFICKRSSGCALPEALPRSCSDLTLRPGSGLAWLEYSATQHSQTNMPVAIILSAVLHETRFL